MPPTMEGGWGGGTKLSDVFLFFVRSKNDEESDVQVLGAFPSNRARRHLPPTSRELPNPRYRPVWMRCLIFDGFPTPPKKIGFGNLF